MPILDVSIFFPHVDFFLKEDIKMQFLLEYVSNTNYYDSKWLQCIMGLVNWKKGTFS